MFRAWRNRNRPVYIVAGFQRSGTAMMMQALEAGGLKVDRARSGERHDDYELPQEAYESITYEALANTDTPDSAFFPRAHRGRLIKVLVGGVADVHPQPGGIVCVFMHRRWEHITASYEKRHGLPLRRDWAEKAITRELVRWRGREDVTLHEFDYDEVLANPLGMMQLLQASGWPVNAKRAARVVRPEPAAALQAVPA